MALNGINFGNLLPAQTARPAGGAVWAANNSADDFGALVKSAVEAIDQTEKAAEGEIAKAVTGESPDLHKTIIQLQTADLKFQLGLQVRNKLIGAYEEIMRMQV